MTAMPISAHACAFSPSKWSKRNTPTNTTPKAMPEIYIGRPQGCGWKIPQNPKRGA